MRAARSTAILLAALLLAGGALRFLGLDWDEGQHLHPDERFLTMVQGAQSLPASFRDYLDTDRSTLNPRNVGFGFFVYGTWPMTLVHVTAARLQGAFGNLPPATDASGAPAPDAPPLARLVPRWMRGGTDYGSVYLVGRAVNALLDLVALLLVFGVGARLYGRRVGLLAAALAAFTAFHIQQSHFFTVDAATNAFVMLFFLGAVDMVLRRSWSGTVVAGVGLGLALASKIAVWPLVPLAMAAVAVEAFARRDQEPHPWRRAALHVVLLGVVSFATLRVAQPDMFAGPGWSRVVADPVRYGEVTAKLPAGPGGSRHWWYTLDAVLPPALDAVLLPDPRWLANMEEIKAQVGGAVDFPPNHQWFGRTPFVFAWVNMVVWGMGLPLGLAAWLAWAAAAVALVRGDRRHLLPWLWVTGIFLYQGGQWVKTMRYFLVIYPLLTLLAAWALVALLDRARAAGARHATGSIRDRLRAWAADPPPALARGLVALVLGGTVIWGAMVASIYARDHSRVAASRWIYRHVPTAFGLVLAGEDGGYLPASHPAGITYEQHVYTLTGDATLGAMRVLVPGTEPRRVDAAHLSHVTDPAGDDAPEVVRAWLSTDPNLAPESSPGTLASGETAVRLERDRPTQVRIPFGQEIELRPGGEYYLWIEVAGAPIAGRPSIIAVETSWDDALPAGLDGYGGFDDPASGYGEGMYGSSHLELFDEDWPEKADKIVTALEEADYTILSSNRVYDSVDQIPTRFPITLRYYELLFGGQMGFRHVADIHRYPRLGPIEVRDTAAEEAWSVYDHPKVDIYQKTDAFDAEATRRELLAAAPLRTWEGIARGEEGLLGRLLGLLPARGGESAEVRQPPEVLLLSEARKAEQRRGGTWTDLVDVGGVLERVPVLAVVAWYLALLALGVLAFPLLFAALDTLADRGWAVSRAAGLLIVAWLGWLASSVSPDVGTAAGEAAATGAASPGGAAVGGAGQALGEAGRALVSPGLFDHTPMLSAAMVAVLAAVALLAAWPRRAELTAWVRAHRRLILAEEAGFAALFLLFLAIRIGNPDLWHPYYGGEKPMDLAYLNAVVRTTSFPPYDPWFAGGQMNYYYYGFILIAALVHLTGITTEVAYNLAVPSLAAMTGLGVAGVAYAWARAMRRGPRPAAVGAVLAAVLAVVAGNLFQVQMIAKRLADVSPSSFRSHLPGLETAVRMLGGATAVLLGRTPLPIDNGHLYWNASRAIPAMGEVEPITEFPFFTFLYADLHAHMMALPLTVLALAVALSWALPAPGGWRRQLWRPGRLAALFLGALAIGSLWPANTWDFPTYGLVAAGALAVGLLRRFERPNRSWLFLVGLQGLALLALSMLLFRPYHQTYVQPYADFSMWRSIKTPLSAYLTVHGVFLFAILSWAITALVRDLRRPEERAATLGRLGVASFPLALVLGGLWLWSLRQVPAGSDPATAPSPWTPLFIGAMLAVGLAVLGRPRARSPERFMAWLLVLGTALTAFVEYVVLSGDIGRMNTVFKFYIQVWVLWSVLAGVAVATLLPLTRRAAWGRAWEVGLGALVAAALVYPITAAPAKVRDRFLRMGELTEAQHAAYDAGQKPGLSGAAFQDYAVYDDDGDLLTLAYDRDGFRWFRETVTGTPVILEGYREKAYRWGSRYSINTGLPTVIGWDFHQKQQRAAVGGEIVDQRKAEVAEMYNTTDDARALDLLSTHDVEYVVVGEMERAIYDPAGLDKFDRWASDGRAEVAYENDGVTIYRLAR